MTRRTICLVASLLAAAGALAADAPEAVYARMHAAALARDLDEMRRYAAEARRAELTVPDVPKKYRLTGKAVRKDGNAVELRASGTADSVGLGYTQMFGVVDLVRENGEWKVERLSWSTGRPGEYPEGYVVVLGPAPQPRSSAEPQAPRFTLPPSPPEPSHLRTQRAQEPKPGDPGFTLQRPPPPCVIKPVMTDDDLRACGAQLPE
jgi:hypothetical protein